MRSTPRIDQMSPIELQTELDSLDDQQLDNNAFVSHILTLCDKELAWHDTSNYTGTVEISDIVQALRESSIDIDG